MIEEGDKLLIKQEKKDLMKGLHEFPFIEHDGQAEIGWLKKQMEKILGCRFKIEVPLEKKSHTFTKYKAHLQPYRCQLLSSTKRHTEYFFADIETLEKYPFSSGHRKIMQCFSKTLA